MTKLKDEMNQEEVKNDENSKKVPPEKVIYSLAENYESLESSLVKQLSLETPNHHLTTGTNREDIWLTLFERIIPRKFCIEQGVFIIDSYGNISAEVDLAVFDEQYTPYIFNYGKIKFIPIEAVAVAIQCKSKSVDIDNVKDWGDTITGLKTALNAFARIQTGLIDTELDKLHSKFKLQDEKYKNDSKNNQKPTTQSQTSTRPILILCKLDNSAQEASKKFDIVLRIKKGKLIKEIPHEDKDLTFWYEKLNHYDHKRYEENEQKLKDLSGICIENSTESEKRLSHRTLQDLKVYMDPERKDENVTLSLTFQLNQLLMLINNPLFFPHQSYVKMFNDNIEKFKKQGENHEKGR